MTSSARPGDLRITEIFTSIQGESDTAGWPTVFIRLTGCPLRCVWCDTAYAFHGGQWRALDSIVEQVTASGVTRVCVTGGEPLAQKRCLELLTALCDAGCRVSLETSGALAVDRVDPRVVKVMDLKAPGSGEESRNRWENLDHLNPEDQLKIVIADRADFDWAVDQVRNRSLERWTVWLSPAWESLSAGELADWLLESGIHARMQVQLHKVLWGDVPGR